jgi:hypothetical protein
MDQHEPYKIPEVNSYTLEGQIVPAPLVVPVVLL